MKGRALDRLAGARGNVDQDEEQDSDDEDAEGHIDKVTLGFLKDSELARIGFFNGLPEGLKISGVDQNASSLIDPRTG